MFFHSFQALLVAVILTSPTRVPADGQPLATARTAQAQPVPCNAPCRARLHGEPTPFLKLLPCPARVGVAALLEPHNIFDSDWHGLGVHVRVSSSH
jgi:Gpi16 subunit, GPI transamidase component